MKVHSERHGEFAQRWPATSFASVSLVMTLAALCSAPATAADCIAPSKNVVNSVTLRAQPSATSATRGLLKAGDSLPLIASMPRWYETRLADGQPAFASKSWTELTSCPAPPEGGPPAVGPVPTAGTFEIHAIDVGTGLSVLVRGADFALLYDAGSNDDTALGDQNRTLAYLKTLTPAVTSINHVILSHPHRDHVELLPDVVNQFKPADVWNPGAYNDICGYRNFLRAIANEPAVRYHTALSDEGNEFVILKAKQCYGTNQPTQTLTLTHGKRIDHDPIVLGQNASMTVLYADGSPHTNFNENSLVIRLDLGSHRVLLMGDAEAGGRQAPTVAPSSDSIEGKLLACCAADLKAEVLVVGHHGSKTSSRKAFLSAVGASIFVISAGPTKYASVVLPDAEIVDELEGLGRIFRTDLHDDECLQSASKVGPDEDGKPGGCDNVLITLPPSGPIAADYRVVSD